MRRMVVVFVGALTAALVSGCASGQSFVRAGYDFGSIKRVAVVKVTGANNSVANQQAIADYFVAELMKKGYAVVERAQIEEIMKEQRFQASEATSAQDAAEIGRILNVDAVLIANVPELSEKIHITAKLIDTADASVLWTGTGSGKTGRTIATIGGAVAGAGTGMLLGGSRSGKVAGGALGGVAGGLAGYALTPEELSQTQKVVTRICEGLPARVR